MNRKESLDYLNDWDTFRLEIYLEGLKKHGKPIDRYIKKRIIKILDEKDSERGDFENDFLGLFQFRRFGGVGEFINTLVEKSNWWQIMYIKKHSKYNDFQKLVANFFTYIIYSITQELDKDTFNSTFKWSILPEDLLQMYDNTEKLGIYKDENTEKQILELVDRYNVPFEERN